MFLVATYVMKPRNPNRTKEKGYMKDPANIQYDEQLYVVRKLNKKDQTYGKIIIDFAQKKIVRNGFNPELSYKDLVKYFYTNYENYLKPVLQGMDPETYNELTNASQNVQTKEEKGSGSQRTASPESADARSQDPTTESDHRGSESNSTESENAGRGA